jgi:hypothetical protein
MAFRQTTWLAEILLRLVGLDRDVLEVTTPSHRQKTLAVQIPLKRRRFDAPGNRQRWDQGA